MRAFSCTVVITAMSGCAERDPKALTVKVGDSTTVPEVSPIKFPTHAASEQHDNASGPEVIQATPWYKIRGEPKGKGAILVYVDTLTGLYVGKLNVNVDNPDASRAPYAGWIVASGALEAFATELESDAHIRNISIEAAQGHDPENINLRVPTQFEISTLRRRLAK